eukprot:231655-Rhodomonas_salina.1
MPEHDSRLNRDEFIEDRLAPLLHATRHGRVRVEIGWFSVAVTCSCIDLRLCLLERLRECAACACRSAVNFASTCLRKPSSESKRHHP